ncbi:AAA family ATPase [Luteolibacter soli]|uniref:AAA family ATPase n=1 Tax=Luteolibacter soli TaxID=3135280 RepID=A0ABU9AYI1_9BACT
MKFISIDLPALPDVNLGPIRMNNLGQVVVIAGRNGAGKSRLLNTITIATKKLLKITPIEQRIQSFTDALAQNRNPARHKDFFDALIKAQAELKYRRQFELSEDRSPVIVPFVPTQIGLTDPSQLAKGDILTQSKKVELPGIAHLSRGCFSKIQNVQDRYWEATHPATTISGDEVTAAKEEFGRLNLIVRQFLNTEITRSVNGEACLFGLPLGSTNLSAGQSVIVQLCIAIHAQGARLNDLIIFMDEPENHLHPAALLDMIEAVQSHIGNGQLWIATHSVPLLASVDASSIWWMEGNTIGKAGSTPEKVLTGLLGEEKRREQLASFLDLPFALASNRYAAECLVPPITVDHREDDPQTNQIREMFDRLRQTRGSLRILDFGAGKGRLASELAESWTEEVRRSIDYVAFDPSASDASECRSAISRLCGDAEGRLFHDATELRARFDAGSFDVVVMCNVLHEIHPSDWNGLFGEEGKVTKVLRPDGFLLLVEVQQLPYGEKAHQHGFIVLDTAQLKVLFAVTEQDNQEFIVDSRRDGWLKAHLIGRQLLTRYSAANRNAAFRDLTSTARDRIRDLRAGAGDYRQGRLHGFWLQQFANSQLALDE